MTINKNFVVKNGFEVSTNLLIADSQKRKVSIGNTNPEYTLDVTGGIGVTDLYVSGIGTFANELKVGPNGSTLNVLGVGGSIGIGTASPSYLLDIRSPVSSGTTALYIQGDVKITGNASIDGTNGTNLNLANIGQLIVSDGIITNNTGVSTFNGNVNINSSVITSGIATFNGYVDINNSVDISQNLNVSGVTTLANYTNITNSLNVTQNAKVGGILTTSTIISSGASFSNLVVSGISTFNNDIDLNSSLDVSTNLTVGQASQLGNVRISSGIVTASVGIVTYYGDGNKLDLTQNPSRGVGIATTGGTVGYGITFINFKGTAISTAFYNSSSGIATIFINQLQSGIIGIGTTFPTSPAPKHGDLFYNIEYARLFVYYNESNVGIGSDNYWVDSSPFTLGSLDSVFSINPSGINVTGVITATTFYGDGSNLTGTGSTVINDTTTNDSFYPVFTKITSGIITASRVSTSQLSFNPSTGTLTASRVSIANSAVANQIFASSLNASGTISGGTISGTSVTGTTVSAGTTVSGSVLSASTSINTPLLTATEIRNSSLVNYTEKIYNFGNTGASPNLNLNNGIYVIATLDQNAIFTFTMPPSLPSGAFGFVLQLKNGAGGLSITWPASVKWPQTSVPGRTTTLGRTDLWSFVTYDGGTTWLGSLSLIDFNI